LRERLAVSVGTTRTLIEELLEGIADIDAAEPAGEEVAEEVAQADGKEQPSEPSRRPIRRPTDLQTQIATYYEESGETQHQVAETCSRKLKTLITQKSVSLAVKAVNRWRQTNSALNLPQIQTRKKRVISVSLSSDKIDSGRRTHAGQGMKTAGQKQVEK
jgi:hypothetical protein